MLLPQRRTQVPAAMVTNLTRKVATAVRLTIVIMATVLIAPDLTVKTADRPQRLYNSDRPYRPRFNPGADNGDRPQRPRYNNDNGDRPHRPRYNSEGRRPSATLLWKQFG